MGFALFQILAAAGVFPANELQSGAAAWLAVWGVFTLGMFVSTFRLNRVLQYIFGTLVGLFVLLAWGEYDSTVKKVAGWLGMFCAAGAMYLGWAELTNEVYARTIMPIFPMKKPDQFKV